MERKQRTTNRTRPQDSRACGGGQAPSAAAAPAADRLSSLPDEVVLSIVRHLPVREAVRMSILSRRWRRLPSLLPVLDELDLSSSRAGKQGESDRFEEFDGAMSAHWGLIRRCSFESCKREEKRAFDRWAEAIAARGVRELELILQDERFDAYPVLHHCKSLTKLELTGGALTGETAAAAFPLGCTDLRELRLFFVDICDGLLQELISTCVRLETLRVWECIGLGRLRIDASPCLRRLAFAFNGAVDVGAPNLQNLDIGVVTCCKELSVRAPKLTSLGIHPIQGEGENLQHCEVVAEWLRNLMNNATNLLSLKMHGALLHSLFPSQCLSPSLAPESLFPSFHSLTRLSIRVSLQDDQQASGLAILLQRCDCLQVLDLVMIQQDPPPHRMVPFHPVLLFWDHQKMLQQMGCLSCHLREVTMLGLTGGIYEIELACFFLMEARVLKELTLYFDKKCTKAMDMLAKHLPNLKKGSPEAKSKLHRLSH